MKKYTIFIHPQDDLAFTEKALIESEQDKEYQCYQMDQGKFDVMKHLIAPGATDEEFWPRGQAYIAESDKLEAFYENYKS